MLKHCAPSSVDVTRRSRKTLEVDEVSLPSSEESKKKPQSQSLRLYKSASDLDEAKVKDVATSPLIAGGARRGRIPLAVLTRRLAKSAKASSSNQEELLPPPSRVAIKVYAKCLRSDIEYKTLSISSEATSKEVIWMLLSKYKMKHRDPKLFYLTMDISIKRTGIPLRRSLSLDDDSRPVELKSCHPWGDCKFTLQMRKGGVVRIYDSVLMAESKYKCLLVSEATTVQEVIQMLFRCYGLNDPESRLNDYCIFEVNPSLRPTGERRLFMEDKPMLIQTSWSTLASANDISECKFVLRSLCGGSDSGSSISMDDASYLSNNSSEFSALRFSRGSAGSESTRSSDSSTDSGLFKSSPECRVSYLKNSNIRRQQKQKKELQSVLQLTPDRGFVSTTTISRQVSLTSLLEALPAASVDTGDFDARSRGASVSSLSLESRTSDYDSFFYI